MSGLDDVPLGAGVLHHVTPWVIGAVVCAAYRPTGPSGPAPVGASHAPRCFRHDVHQACLAVTAADRFARGVLYAEVKIQFLFEKV